MASVKITIGMRIAIRDAVLEHRFGKERQAIQERYNKLAQVVYNDQYSAEDQRLMNSLPPDYLPTTTHMYVDFGDRRYNFDLGAEPKRYASQRERPRYDTKHPLTKTFDAIQKAAGDLSKDEAAAAREVNAVLKSATTIASLLKVWPEVAPFVERYAPPPPKKLPVVNTKRLNKTLQLP